MADEIRPVLSPEEWERRDNPSDPRRADGGMDWPEEGPGWLQGRPGIWTEGGAVFWSFDTPEMARDIAARALQVAGPNGEPLFTYEDAHDEIAELAALEAHLSEWTEKSQREDIRKYFEPSIGDPMASLRARIERKRARVTKLLALLPPEKILADNLADTKESGA